MSRGFVKEGDQEEVPFVEPRAALPQGVTNYVTPTGLTLLHEERKSLIMQRDANKENRLQYNYYKAKLVHLDERINSAVLVDFNKSPKDVIGFGAWVVYLQKEQKHTIRIVGVDEADIHYGKISFLSPLAKALISHKIQDDVGFIFAGSLDVLKILEISYDEEFQCDHLISVKKSGSHTMQGVKTDKPKKVHIEMPVAEEVSVEKVQEVPSKEDEDSEFLPIVNERGNLVGRAMRWQCHNGNKILHPVVHLHIFNSKGELFLQKRPAWKKIQPDKWDTAVGGHIQLLESKEDALKREAEEELGIKDFKPALIKSYIWESAVEKELVYVYKTIYDKEIFPSEETDGGRFWSIAEIKDNLKKKVFTQNFEKEFSEILR